MLNFIQRHLMAYRLFLVGGTLAGLYFYHDVFIFIPFLLLPALFGARKSRSREKYKNNSYAMGSIEYYDGVVWIWRGFPSKPR